MSSLLVPSLFCWHAVYLFVLAQEVAHPDLKFDEEGLLLVYIDGACINTGRPYAKAGYGVWFNFNHTLNLSAPVTGTAANINAEIEAATKAIQQAISIGIKRIKIHTDSMLLLCAVNDWIHKWKQNNWLSSKQKPIRTKEKFLELDKAISSMERVEWVYVETNSTVAGNQEAVTLAKAGAAQYERKRN